MRKGGGVMIDVDTLYMWGMISWYVLIGAMVLIVALPTILHYLNGKKANVSTTKISNTRDTWEYKKVYCCDKMVYGIYKNGTLISCIDREWLAEDLIEFLKKRDKK
jgi:hypothetical protein